MISSAFVPIFFLFIILMAAAVAVLTIVYVAKPRPKTKESERKAIVASAQLEVLSLAEPAPHVAPSPPVKDVTSPAGPPTITYSSDEQPAKQGSMPHESALATPHHRPSRPKTIPDKQSHTKNASRVAEQEPVPPATAAGDKTPGESRREQSDMKIGIFGSQSKDKKPQDTKLAKAAASKKEVKTNEGVRRSSPQPAAVLVRQPVRERPETKPTPPPTPEPAAEIKAPIAPEAPVKEKMPEPQPKAAAEATKTNSMPPAAPPPQATPQPPTDTQKASAGGLSDLFAKTSLEPTENSRLADGMSDIDTKDLLTEGLGLVAKFRKPAK